MKLLLNLAIQSCLGIFVTIPCVAIAETHSPFSVVMTKPETMIVNVVETTWAHVQQDWMFAWPRVYGYLTKIGKAPKLEPRYCVFGGLSERPKFLIGFAVDDSAITASGRNEPFSFPSMKQVIGYHRGTMFDIGKTTAAAKTYAAEHLLKLRTDQPICLIFTKDTFEDPKAPVEAEVRLPVM